MPPRRSQRVPKPITIREEKEALPAASDPKITSATTRTRPETALKPVAAEPLPEASKLDSNDLPDLLHYLPPLKLQYNEGRPLASGLSPLQAFLLFFTQEMVDLIVYATNAYASRKREIETEVHLREWTSTNSIDIWRYLGCLIYIEIHTNAQRATYWSMSHRLGRFLSLKRFE
jgi:Transposase IS4